MDQNLWKFAWLHLTRVTTIFDILFNLGIHRGNVKLGPKTGIFEVQMGAEEDLEKIWDKYLKFNL